MFYNELNVMKALLTKSLFITLYVVASGSKTRMEFQFQNETCVIECISTLDGDLCKSICGENATLYEDNEDLEDNLDDPDEEEKSIIEAGKVYNSRLNVVVYSLMTGRILIISSDNLIMFYILQGFSIFTVVYAVYLTYRCSH